MKENKGKVVDSNNERTIIYEKIKIFLEFFSVVISVLALIISMHNAWQTNDTYKQVVTYQLEQERLPRVVALNYNLPLKNISFDVYYKNKLDFTYLSSGLYPIKFPIYNVGVGIAQNCKIEWNGQSINDACRHLVEVLNQYCYVNEYDYSDYPNKYEANADYNVNITDGIYKNVLFATYYSKNDDFDNYDYDIVIEDIMCKDDYVPYLMPVSDRLDSAYISLSKGVSVLLLELANQKDETPISFEFNISYQDLAGAYYSENVKVTFQLVTKESIDNEELIFEISFEIM